MNSQMVSDQTTPVQVQTRQNLSAEQKWTPRPPNQELATDTCWKRKISFLQQSVTGYINYFQGQAFGTGVIDQHKNRLIFSMLFRCFLFLFSLIRLSFSFFLSKREHEGGWVGRTWEELKREKNMINLIKINLFLQYEIQISNKLILDYQIFHI